MRQVIVVEEDPMFCEVCGSIISDYDYSNGVKKWRCGECTSCGVLGGDYDDDMYEYDDELKMHTFIVQTEEDGKEHIVDWYGRISEVVGILSDVENEYYDIYAVSGGEYKFLFAGMMLYSLRFEDDSLFTLEGDEE